MKIALSTEFNTKPSFKARSLPKGEEPLCRLLCKKLNISTLSETYLNQEVKGKNGETVIKKYLIPRLMSVLIHKKPLRATKAIQDPELIDIVKMAIRTQNLKVIRDLENSMNIKYLMFLLDRKNAPQLPTNIFPSDADIELLSRSVKRRPDGTLEAKRASRKAYNYIIKNARPIKGDELNSILNSPRTPEAVKNFLETPPPSLLRRLSWYIYAKTIF